MSFTSSYCNHVTIYATTRNLWPNKQQFNRYLLFRAVVVSTWLLPHILVKRWTDPSKFLLNLKLLSWGSWCHGRGDRACWHGNGYLSLLYIGNYRHFYLPFSSSAHYSQIHMYQRRFTLSVTQTWICALNGLKSTRSYVPIRNLNTFWLPLNYHDISCNIIGTQ